MTIIEGKSFCSTLIAVEMWDQSLIFDKEKLERKPKGKGPVTLFIDQLILMLTGKQTLDQCLGFSGYMGPKGSISPNQSLCSQNKILVFPCMNSWTT